MGVFKKLILGWIQVDRMMVLCWKRSVVIIFDINEYGGLRTLSRRDWATLLAIIPWEVDGQTVE
jgi:hypothetical protein